MIFKHIIIEGKLKEINRLNDLNNLNCLHSEENIKQFLTQLCKIIKVNILYGPVAIRGSPHNDGYTGFVIVDYSHIALHTYLKTNLCALDIYTCKDFDTQILVEFVKGYIANIKHKEVKRPL